MKLKKKLKIIEKKINQAIKQKDFHLLDKLFLELSMIESEINKKKEFNYCEDELFI